MSGIHRTAVSLGFFGDDLDPEAVTAALGGAPTMATRKDHPFTTPLGATRVANTGSWRRQAERASPGDLDGQIIGLLAQLTDDLEVWNALSRRFGGRLFCGLFMEKGNEGLRLEAPTVAAIGARGLHLDLDVYGPDLAD